MVTGKGDWRTSHKPLADPIAPSETDQLSLSKRMTTIWLTGVVVLLPLDMFRLPLNVTPVDIWILMGLPIFWLTFIRGSHIISLSYVVPMWFILLASFASTFAAPAARSSLIVIMKEIYAFVWFVTLTAVLSKLNARDFRRLLMIWAAVVLVHGLVIVAQFLSPEFWRFVVRFAGNTRELEVYRSPGFFANPNSAAFFQLLGFVPVILASPSKRMAMILGAVLFSTMLATGSMGATLAFLTGLMVSLTIILLSGHLAVLSKIFMRLAITIAIIGGMLSFIVGQNERYQERLEGILLGRSERSSEGRFDLWQRGLDAYINHNVFLWGVGPENFREVDEKKADNQLHNDFIAFAVERGLLGSIGLVAFAVLVVSRAVYMVMIHHKYPERAQLVVVVFLGAIVATMVESLTHQTFHFRELWLILACQEALLYKMTASESGVREILYTFSETPHRHRGFVIQPDVSG